MILKSNSAVLEGLRVLAKFKNCLGFLNDHQRDVFVDWYATYRAPNVNNMKIRSKGGNLLFQLHNMLVTQNVGDENNLKVIYKRF